jgi:ketosteroid isomerase-like protein
MPATITETLDLDALRATIDRDGSPALAAYLADDVEWIEIDQRTPPRAPAALHGRDAVVAMLRDTKARGIVSRVGDGFVAGDRAALAVTCSFPEGGSLVAHGLVTLREGKIARWVGVQAWDE